MEFELKISGHNELFAHLRNIGDLDLKEPAQEIAKALVEGNREGLLKGQDADGHQIHGVKRGDGGPPTAPHGSASRTIANFVTEVQKHGSGYEITGTWKDADFIRFLNSKFKIVGIRPETMKKITEILERFARNQGGKS